MPVTGSRDITKILRGPTVAIVNGPVPADGAIVPLTAGLPASGVNLGLTEAGWKISATYTETSEEADETAVPFNKIVDVETLSAACSMFQVEDFALLKLMTPTGTYTLNAGVSEKITFGGAIAISATAKPSIMIIGPQTTTPSLYVYVIIYQAINTAGIEFDWTRKQSVRVPITLEAVAQASRTAGDQAGAIVKLLA